MAINGIRTSSLMAINGKKTLWCLLFSDQRERLPFYAIQCHSMPFCINNHITHITLSCPVTVIRLLRCFNSSLILKHTATYKLTQHRGWWYLVGDYRQEVIEELQHTLCRSVLGACVRYSPQQRLGIRFQHRNLVEE